jgi:hypothetical protein
MNFIFVMWILRACCPLAVIGSGFLAYDSIVNGSPELALINAVLLIINARLSYRNWFEISARDFRGHK